MPTAPAPTSGGKTAPAPKKIPVSGPVTPEEIYQLLIAKGLSTTQAIGVMANMFAESRLSPESGGTDNNGYWAGGLIGWNAGSYPNAHQLVTGDPQKDVRAQIDYLFTSTNGVSAGLAGSTPQEVAGNWAANVERCEGCQPGSNFPNGWAARRGYATMISGWQSSGKWPKAAGGQVGPGAGGGAGSSGARCLVRAPIIGCILSTSNARAIVGGLLVAAALPVGLTGAVVLTAFAFRRTGAGAAAGRATEAVGAGIALIPGGEAAGAAVATAGSAQARRAKARKSQQDQARAGKAEAARERRNERDYDQVMARRGDSASGPAVRDDPPF